MVTQAAKKIIFTACHLGKLKLSFTSPDVISNSLKNFLTSKIDFTVLLLIEFLKKDELPVGQFKNRIHWRNSKIHYSPRVSGHYFLYTLPPLYKGYFFVPPDSDHTGVDHSCLNLSTTATKECLQLPK